MTFDFTTFDSNNNSSIKFNSSVSINFRRTKATEIMETNSIEELQYQQALMHVKKIKGFYTHLTVYLVVNVMILIVNYQD